MRKGSGKILAGIGLLILGLWLLVAQNNTDGGLVWPIVGLLLVVWGGRQRIAANSANVGHSAAIAKTIVRAQAEGAPRPPWNPVPADQSIAQRLASLLSQTGPEVVLREADGPFGVTVELNYSEGLLTADPLAIISRTWDRDTRKLKTIVTFSCPVTTAMATALSDGGFERLEPSAGPYTVFHR